MDHPSACIFNREILVSKQFETHHIPLNYPVLLPIMPINILVHPRNSFFRGVARGGPRKLGGRDGAQGDEPGWNQCWNCNRRWRTVRLSVAVERRDAVNGNPWQPVPRPSIDPSFIEAAQPRPASARPLENSTFDSRQLKCGRLRSGGRKQIFRWSPSDVSWRAPRFEPRFPFERLLRK